MKRLPALLALVFAFFGIADSWYLAESALEGTPLNCNLGAALDGCNVVAQSAYSHLFGVPLALYGVFFYGLAFILAAMALHHGRTMVVRAFFAVGLLGLLASIAFVCIQIFIIQAVCVYCLGSALLSLGIFWVAAVILRRDMRPMPINPA